MDTLKQLMELGFAPLIALLIATVIFLFGILSAVVMAMWYYFRKDRDARDLLREQWHSETKDELGRSEKRLSQVEADIRVSDERHKACESDRESLKDTVKDLQGRVQRFEKCTNADKCPMRLP